MVGTGSDASAYRTKHSKVRRVLTGRPWGGGGGLKAACEDVFFKFWGFTPVLVYTGMGLEHCSDP